MAKILKRDQDVHPNTPQMRCSGSVDAVELVNHESLRCRPVELLRYCPALSVTHGMVFASRGLQSTPAAMQSRQTHSSRFATERSTQHEVGGAPWRLEHALEPELSGTLRIGSSPAFARLWAAQSVRRHSSGVVGRERRPKSSKLATKAIRGYALAVPSCCADERALTHAQRRVVRRPHGRRRA